MTLAAEQQHSNRSCEIWVVVTDYLAKLLSELGICLAYSAHSGNGHGGAFQAAACVVFFACFYLQEILHCIGLMCAVIS